MNHSDIAALMKGVAPVIRDLLSASIQPLLERVEELERELAAERGKDHSAEVDAAVARAFATLPVPQNGRDADLEEVRAFIQSELSALPPAEPGAPGKDADPELVRQLVERSVDAAIAALPAPENGKDADPERVRQMIADQVATLPAPAPGKDADPELVRQLVADAIAALPPARDGEAGAPGKLPVVRDYSGGVHYEGDVVTFDGSTYQATKDTGFAPPHADWACLARAGRNGDDGEDGRSFRILGTYAEGLEYSALDVVSLNGASFAAKRDNPGSCPGEGWQLIAAQGKRGAPGEGRKGDPGRPGEAGLPLVGAQVDEAGVVTLVNGDGSTVELDLYPVLSRIGGAE